jgi:hypothetical protein
MRLARPSLAAQIPVYFDRLPIKDPTTTGMEGEDSMEQWSTRSLEIFTLKHDPTSLSDSTLLSH